MPLTPVDSVGLVAVGAASAASTLGAQSASFAGLVRGKLRSMQPGVAQLQLPNGSAVDLGQLRGSLRADLKQIQSRLTAAAAQNGMDIGNGVTMQVDSNGVSHVLASSQQQASIENLIAGDPQLDHLIASAAQKARVLQAAQTGSSGQISQQSFASALSALSGPLASATLLVSPQRTAIQVSSGT